jgi:hypothetical protein
LFFGFPFKSSYICRVEINASRVNPVEPDGPELLMEVGEEEMNG